MQDSIDAATAAILGLAAVDEDKAINGNLDLTSFEIFLSILQCPACAGDLAFIQTTSDLQQRKYGILRCRCSSYPVIDEVPILMKGPVGIIFYWAQCRHAGPNAQGAYEDADMMSYTERMGRVDKAELRAALADPTSAAASRLVGRFILMVVPDRFVRSETIR